MRNQEQVKKNVKERYDVDNVFQIEKIKNYIKNVDKLVGNRVINRFLY